ncbi:DNA alkylation repair protein [Lachnospiraceae bacterium 62-35]
MNTYIQYLSELIPDKDSLKLVKEEAKKFYKEHTAQECYDIYPVLYQSANFQIQEVGVLLAGYIADEYPDALAFLHDTVSQHESWKVQEILAMAFDNYCAKIKYENALPIIKEWFGDMNANIRRAASEGLRIWTSRPHFKEHPEVAIALLGSRREDESEYVRKSAGNSLRDISKKFPDLVSKELSTWDLSSKKTAQVFKLASRFLDRNFHVHS